MSCRTRQRTLNVDGRKIVIRRRTMTTQAGNFAGQQVKINGVTFRFRDLITLDEAEERAFARWVKFNAIIKGATK